MKTNTIKLYNPLDMHLHLRDNDMLNLIAPLSSRYFKGALIMPNLIKPIQDIDSVISYKKRILKAISFNKNKNNISNFTPFMSLFFDKYDYNFLKQAKEHILAIKLYPAGITTNSAKGIKNIDINNLHSTLKAMSELNIPLCVHGESNGFVMDRESEFLDFFNQVCEKFPKLKVIMEHISTKNACDLLDKYENLYASITLHHLLYTLDDLAGGMLNPHLFCKPILKNYEDRKALLNLALNGHSKIMFGSDSAPHPKHKKECCGCAAGVFSASISLQVLCELFDKHNKLNNLQKFISDNALKIYNINFNKINKNETLIDKVIVLKKQNFKVVDKYEGFNNEVVPMKSKTDISWSVV